MDMRKTPKGIQTLLARFYHYFLFLSLTSASEFLPHLTMRVCPPMSRFPDSFLKRLTKRHKRQLCIDGSFGPSLHNHWPMTIPSPQTFTIFQVNSAKMGGLILMSSSSSNIIISLMQSRRKGKVSWDESMSEQSLLSPQNTICFFLYAFSTSGGAPKSLKCFLSKIFLQIFDAIAPL